VLRIVALVDGTVKEIRRIRAARATLEPSQAA
jgi:hypothetical protein